MSICRKFLRIDNAKIIAEAAISLNGKTRLYFTIKTFVSDTYSANSRVRKAFRLAENALFFLRFQGAEGQNGRRLGLCFLK